MLIHEAFTSIIKRWQKKATFSFFQWLSIIFALSILILAVQVKYYANFSVPPGVDTNKNYFTLGFSSVSDKLGRISLLQMNNIKNIDMIDSYSSYTQTDYSLSVSNNKYSRVNLAFLDNEFLIKMSPHLSIGQAWSKDKKIAIHQIILGYDFWVKQLHTSPDVIGMKIKDKAQKTWLVTGVMPKGFNGFGAKKIDAWLSSENQDEMINDFSAVPDQMSELKEQLALRVPAFFVLGILNKHSSSKKLSRLINKLDWRMPALMFMGSPVMMDNSYVSRPVEVVKGLNIIPSLTRKIMDYADLLFYISIAINFLVWSGFILFLIEQVPERLAEFKIRFCMGATLIDIYKKIAGENLIFILTALPLAFVVSLFIFSYLGQIEPFSFYIPQRLHAPSLGAFSLVSLVVFLIVILVTLIPILILTHNLSPDSTSTTKSQNILYLERGLNILQISAAFITLLTAVVLSSSLFFLSTLNWENAHLNDKVVEWKCEENSSCPNIMTMPKINVKLFNRDIDVGDIGFSRNILFDSTSALNIVLSSVINAEDITSNNRLHVKNIGISRRYLEGIGAHVIAGTLYDDNSNSAIIVNRSFAAKSGFKPERLIHQQFTAKNNSNQKYTVVAVIENLRFPDIHYEPGPMVFHPLYSGLSSHFSRLKSVLISDKIDSEVLVKKVKNALALQGIKNQQVVVNTIKQKIAAALKNENKITDMILFIALITVILSFMGIYSSVASTVYYNKRILAIRSVLGASSWQISIYVGLPFVMILLISLFFSGILLGMIQPFLINWLLIIPDYLWLIFIVVSFFMVLTLFIGIFMVLLGLLKLETGVLLSNY